METRIKNIISQSIDIKEKLIADEVILNSVIEVSDVIRKSIENNGKILICGNGGSASDALHIAGEFLGRFQKERRSLPSIALNADVATMTAIANDYGYSEVFKRQVEGLMNPQDILIGISTSGNSVNVLEAIKKANELGGYTFALLGRDGGDISKVAANSIIVPSDVTARIQECHILIAHIICEIVEEAM